MLIVSKTLINPHEANLLTGDNKIKTCKRCGEAKPRQDFYKNKAMKDRLQSYCKSCMNQYHRKWTKKNRVHRRQYLREYLFLYGRHGKNKDRGGYLNGQGFCLYCGELNPFFLEQHHLFGSKNDGFCISLCANHHKMITLYSNFMEWNDTPKLISTKSDLNKAKKDAEYVNRLIAREKNPYKAFLALNKLISYEGSESHIP